MKITVSVPNPSQILSFSRTEKIRQFFPAIRQRLFPKRHLIAGPYLGEFGYELMQWQGYVRARRPFYEEVHVITYPGRDYLYDGCVVHHHDLDLKNAGYSYGWTPWADIRQIARATADKLNLRSFDIFDTGLLCTRYHKMLCWEQDFRLFREPCLPDGPWDVAFHFRAINKTGPDHTRNYQNDEVRRLIELGHSAGWRMLAIGHPNYSSCPEGVADARSVDLKQTIAAICSARLISGELSGPMHLANLCGQPTAFFAEGAWRIKIPLGWNPFRVPQYVIADDTMQPTAERVFKGVSDALLDLRKRTEDFSRPSYTLPAQRISWV
jgi:hypothetical protein